MTKNELVSYFNNAAKKRDYWRKKNWYYHKDLLDFFSFNIPPSSEVLEIGCGTGDLLNSLKPSTGAGFDISPEMIKICKEKYPDYEFFLDDIEKLQHTKKYNYIIIQDLLGHLSDVWSAFRNINKLTSPETRILITYYNKLWEPLILLLEKFNFKMKQPYQNWLSISDIENILFLNGYEVVKSGGRFIFPVYIPLISDILNKYVSKLPLIKKLCLTQFIIAKEMPREEVNSELSCSVVVPAKNEAGNIENAVTRMPGLGKSTEIIFVYGNSTDGTLDRINDVIGRYPDKKIKLVLQGDGIGKGDAVRKGFDAAENDILLILDADLTVPPEDLPKFYLAIKERKGEFINGTRLVYPMEKEAMRPLNILGNKIFSVIFTWTLGQKIKDTLCGTKVISRKNYEKLKLGRKFFGDFDPFGDFDLLFGASKLNLKIVELPVRYCERVYGTTKISRFRHGLLLLRMSVIAFIKLKLN